MQQADTIILPDHRGMDVLDLLNLTGNLFGIKDKDNRELDSILNELSSRLNELEVYELFALANRLAEHSKAYFYQLGQLIMELVERSSQLTISQQLNLKRLAVQLYSNVRELFELDPTTHIGLMKESLQLVGYLSGNEDLANALTNNLNVQYNLPELKSALKQQSTYLLDHIQNVYLKTGSKFLITEADLIEYFKLRTSLQEFISNDIDGNDVLLERYVELKDLIANDHENATSEDFAELQILEQIFENSRIFNSTNNFSV